ncbi:uncharacterized protein LOC105688835 [Athalia rosae]|uniref:uncharacterized protein LOC105688835 n=1 Tax=Athalia rosae TaxID=37344 RepID=UPI002033448A|nr:uncharacterized protein LOC105688835 [Athalia rosae]
MTSEEMKQRKREEYEMQFFSVHSRAVYDGTKNVILEEIESLCQKLCQSIEEKYRPGPDELAILRTDAKRLIQTYQNRAETHMKDLNNIVRKFIAVPNNLLLEEDKAQAIQMSPHELEEMKFEIEDLRKRAKRAKVFNAALRQELEIQKQFEAYEAIINTSSKIIESNTELPNLETKIAKFVHESSKLDMYLNALEFSSEQDRYNPIIKQLNDELDS